MKRRGEGKVKSKQVSVGGRGEEGWERAYLFSTARVRRMKRKVVSFSALPLLTSSGVSSTGIEKSHPPRERNVEKDQPGGCDHLTATYAKKYPAGGRGRGGAPALVIWCVIGLVGLARGGDIIGQSVVSALSGSDLRDALPCGAGQPLGSSNPTTRSCRLPDMLG
ncbi:hypothetical protein B296_00004829 [Ensete ventricosum]|uniref:Uncharacterized protein n=1 Tax=Ensete ventricosum TaxID=4639 RepID=A0A426ZXR7_ENSVE|nr:hypothetical protein B296_00004829 [Ensete ventricosum]